MRSTVTLTVSATFAIDPIREFVEFWNDQLSFDLAVRVGSYNQVLRDLLVKPPDGDDTDRFHFIGIRPEDFIRFMPQQDIKELKTFLQRTSEIYVDSIRKACRNSHDTFLVSVFLPSPSIQDPEVIGFLNESSLLLRESLNDIHNLNFLDVTSIPNVYEVTEVYDADSDSIAHIPFTQEYFAGLGATIVRAINTCLVKPYKVIVVDCDETLWKGICAEDGATGVIVEERHKVLQEFLVSRRDEGFLLALASKNNEADVEAVFQSNAGMVLAYDNFISKKIGWNAKADSLAEIARELGLSVNTFIFVDDNRVECEAMKVLKPEVLTINIDHNTDVIKVLRHTWAFDRIKITEEDSARNASYRAEKERQTIRSEFESLDDFTRYLDVNVSVVQAQTPGLHRIRQLMNRTNQFNLNGIILSEGEIGRRILDNRYAVWEVLVTDKYGDYGRSGAIICMLSGDVLVVESMLLSCRVLGRNVEDQLFDFIGANCRDRHINRIEMRYIPTKSNLPVARFLEKFKFNCENGIWYLPVVQNAVA